MANEFHSFDDKAIQSALDAARAHFDGVVDASAVNPADDGHLAVAGGCISVTVEDGKVCLNLPLGIGKYCFPIPSIIPNGTAAEACLHICTTFGIPTGVRVTISVAGKVIVTKTFGKC
ncbi:hypothetical protein [Falsiruegeria mediterranea]|jgi:hypothetical protein|uniref:Uncharacterized protein n=1 Tax=Falsiruegeria mediterranea M17 TaxID=1200281 RepID=A0A2R8C9A1_9RHOB|nr:hypothetical protein [Falsiruegeria mediterranea]SPJ28985.1 hypothetical protein TRM7615_02495 [Falsiruegeria mediterranea M17]